MKKLLLAALIGCAFSISATAQAVKPQTVNIKTPTVQCGMCKTKIESYLKRVDGVTFVNVKYKGQEKDRVTQVKYFPHRTDVEILKAAIANNGYKADEIDANPEAYKMLPKCCKKPEDGGGMKN